MLWKRSPFYSFLLVEIKSNIPEIILFTDFTRISNYAKTLLQTREITIKTYEQAFVETQNILQDYYKLKNQQDKLKTWMDRDRTNLLFFDMAMEIVQSDHIVDEVNPVSQTKQYWSGRHIFMGLTLVWAVNI